MTDNLITDITTDAQTESYSGGNLRVGFYDGVKNGESALYIYIRLVRDKNTIVRRKAGTKIIGGGIYKETVLYKKAYDKYINLKDLNTPKPKKARKKVEEVATPVLKIEE